MRNLTVGLARDLLGEWRVSHSLRAHCEDVGAAMREICHALGVSEDERETWQVAGLLHDADWEVDPDNHPDGIVHWLTEHGHFAIAEAIASHYSAWGRPATSLMARALLAVDELTGFIRAYATIRPNGFIGMTASSVRRKLKERDFARNCERSEIAYASSMLPMHEDALIGHIIGVLTRCNDSEAIHLAKGM